MSRKAMGQKALINTLAAYRRPGTPIYAYHFRSLPKEES